jgi:hypothetical protein
LSGRIGKKPLGVRKDEKELLALVRTQASRIDSKLAQAEELALREEQEPEKVSLHEEEIPRITGCKTGGKALAQLTLDQLLPLVIATSRRIQGSYAWTVDAVNDVLRNEKPQNPVQSMLLSQMVCCQIMAFHFAEKALKSSNPEIADRLSHRSERLMKTFAEQAETLAKLKGLAGQKIIVEHLNVESGGKALVAGQVDF